MDIDDTGIGNEITTRPGAIVKGVREDTPKIFHGLFIGVNGEGLPPRASQMRRHSSRPMIVIGL
jgi:hypothetical protein